MTCTSLPFVVGGGGPIVRGLVAAIGGNPNVGHHAECARLIEVDLTETLFGQLSVATVRACLVEALLAGTGTDPREWTLVHGRDPRVLDDLDPTRRGPRRRRTDWALLHLRHGFAVPVEVKSPTAAINGAWGYCMRCDPSGRQYRSQLTCQGRCYAPGTSGMLPAGRRAILVAPASALARIRSHEVEWWVGRRGRRMVASGQAARAGYDSWHQVQMEDVEAALIRRWRAVRGTADEAPFAFAVRAFAALRWAEHPTDLPMVHPA